jgi:hypothetical protein
MSFAAVRGDAARLLGFQVVWATCAIGAANGQAWPGVVAAAVALALTIRLAPDGRAVALLAVACGALGLAAESLLIATGSIAHAAAGWVPSLAPAWIVALWAAFAITLAPTLRLLGAAPLAKAALLGVLLGPLSYLAGARIGAITVAVPTTQSLAAIAVIWALAMPVLLAAARLAGTGGGERTLRAPQAPRPD